MRPTRAGLKTGLPKTIGAALKAICCVALLIAGIVAQTSTPKLDYVVKHRVNAHGDEFNGLAQSSDGKRAYIASEKGDVIVWQLAAGKLERTLHQSSPVHHILALNSNVVFATGSNHHEPLNPLMRKWNVDAGTFEDLPGLAADSFPTAAAINSASSLVAVGLRTGTVIVWDINTNKVAATRKVNLVPFSLTIVNRDVYVVGASRESMQQEAMPRENAILQFKVDQPGASAGEFLRQPGRFWYQLNASPDAKTLVGYYRQAGQGDYAVLLDPTSRKEVPLTSGWEIAWVDATTFVQFENYDPAEVLKVANGKVTSVRKFARFENDKDGRAFDQTGQIVNALTTKAWATYRKGPGFLEFDFANGKLRTLLGGPSGAYGISVNTKDGNQGILATSGADGFVRLWNLADLSLQKEYHVATNDQFVTDAQLTANGQQAVAGLMQIPKTIEDRGRYPLQVVLLNLADGSTKKLFEMSPWQGNFWVTADDSVLYPSFDRMKLVKLASNTTVREFVAAKPIQNQTLSAKGKSLAVIDEDNVLTVFDVATGNKISSQVIKPGERGPFAVTNDGQYVHQVTHDGRLLSWKTDTGAMTEHPLQRIKEMFTNVDFVTLADDDKWIVTAGNHGDVGIFDRTTGDLICYEESTAAAFYAERAWLMGDRLMFTTDSGILFDGRLVPAGQK